MGCHPQRPGMTFWPTVAVWPERWKLPRPDQAIVQNDLTEVTVELRGLKQEHDETDGEIASVCTPAARTSRRASWPFAPACAGAGSAGRRPALRRRAAQVREEERDWEGAIERLLHGFGLSLLVPDGITPLSPNGWTGPTSADGWFISACGEPGHARCRTAPDSLARKLAIKPESAFYGWLEAELARRFDLVCCETMEQFRRETKAITRAGSDQGRRRTARKGRPPPSGRSRALRARLVQRGKDRRPRTQRAGT